MPRRPQITSYTRLGTALEKLRPKLAKAAQAVYDAWDQDAEGFDDELGSGGICDRVAEALAEVIAGAVDDVTFVEGGWPGDDHAFTIVYDDRAAYLVDIPAHIYEMGAGYSWKKRPDVTIEPSDVVIGKINRRDVAPPESSPRRGCPPGHHERLKADDRLWRGLKKRGEQHLGDSHLELRDCPDCRSTLVRPLPGHVE